MAVTYGTNWTLHHYRLVNFDGIMLRICAGVFDALALALAREMKNHHHNINDNLFTLRHKKFDCLNSGTGMLNAITNCDSILLIYL